MSSKSSGPGKEDPAARLLVMSFLAVMGFFFGGASLADPDIGWHLAGGLWMLDNRTVPVVDPLGSSGHFWLAYSWLFEVAVAATFRLGGFVGLQLLQALLVICSLFSLWWLTGVASAKFPQVTLVHRFVVLLCIVPLTFPFWYLRPQAVGLICFVILIGLGEAGRLRPALFLPLTVVWANLHLYVLVAPVIVGLYLLLPSLWRGNGRQAVRSLFWTTATALAVLVNPYGVGLVEGMLQYLFNHSSGYRLINEFQPITAAAPFLQGAFVTVLALMLIFAPPILRHCSAATVLLLLPLTVQAAARLKYAPLFGLTAVIPLVQVVAPRLIPPVVIDEPSPGKEWLVWLGTIGAAVGTVIVVALSWPAAISGGQEELSRLAAVLAARTEGLTSKVSVLTHFDDGGWLQFAFAHHEAAPGQGPTVLPTTDGRTLVMGEERLEQFGTLFRAGEGWCSILQSWDPQFALIPNYVPLAQHLRDGSACGESWRTLAETDGYMLLERLPQSIP